MEPIVGRLEREARRLMIPAPVPTPAAERPRVRPQLQQQPKSEAPALSTSFFWNSRSQDSDTSSWDGSPVHEVEVDRPQEPITTEQHLSAQGHDILNKLGNNTLPWNDTRTPTPDPRAAQFRTSPGNMRVAMPQPRTHVSTSYIAQALEWDSEVENLVAISRALSGQRSGTTQLTRPNTVKTQGMELQADVAMRLAQPVVDSHKHQRGVTQVTEQKMQAEHTELLRRAGTISPSETYYTAASVMESSDNAIYIAEPDTATEHEPVTEQGVQVQPEEEGPTTRRSSGNNSSRESRFREMMDMDGPILYAAQLPIPHPQVDQDDESSVRVRAIRRPTPHPHGHQMGQQEMQMETDVASASSSHQPFPSARPQPHPPVQNQCIVKRGLHKCTDKVEAWKDKLRHDEAARQRFPPIRTWWVKAMEKLHIRRKPNRDSIGILVRARVGEGADV